jgi:hypothetical protein
MELYGTDVLVWSERQSELLRRLPAGERPNAEIDWTNAEVGRAQLHRVEGLLLQAVSHM